MLGRRAVAAACRQLIARSQQQQQQQQAQHSVTVLWRQCGASPWVWPCTQQGVRQLHSSAWCQAASKGSSKDGSSNSSGSGSGSGSSSSGRDEDEYVYKKKLEKQKRMERILKEREFLKERLRQTGMGNHLKATKPGSDKRYEAGSKPLKPHEAEPVVQVDMQSAQTREQIELTKACMGHVSFVGLSFKMNGRKHVTQWLRAFTQLPRFGGADAGLLQAFEINVIEGLLFRLLKPLIVRGLVRETDPALLPHCMTVCKTYTEIMCGDFGVHNHLIGYAYLVDWNGLIRWRGHGPASEEELEGLANTTELLVQEWIKSGGQPTPEAQ